MLLPECWCILSINYEQKYICHGMISMWRLRGKWNKGKTKTTSREFLKLRWIFSCLERLFFSYSLSDSVVLICLNQVSYYKVLGESTIHCLKYVSFPPIKCFLWGTLLDHSWSKCSILTVWSLAKIYSYSSVEWEYLKRKKLFKQHLIFFFLPLVASYDLMAVRPLWRCLSWFMAIRNVWSSGYSLRQ